MAKHETHEYLMKLARQELRVYGDTDYYRRLVIAANKAPLA